MNPTPFLDCRETVEKWQHDLPHWNQNQRFQFITWCLGDALPAKAMKRLKNQKAVWLSQHPKPWIPEVAEIFFDKFERRIDRWLIAGRGACVLKNPLCADIVENAFWYFENKKTRMDAYVIMPNHVHCLVQVLDSRLSNIMHSWRSFTGLEINKINGKVGKLWSEDYWDRIIRSPEHYWKVRKYIENNPAKANLDEGKYRLWLRDEPLWNSLQNEGYALRPPWGELDED